MKLRYKILIGFALAIALLVAYRLVSPLFIDKKVSEKFEDIAPSQMMQEEEIEVISQGIFTGLAGHSAEGTAKLFKIEGKYYLRFEDDFMVTNGPDLFVHFGRDGEYLAPARIAALKGNIGGQNYEIPEEFNPSDYNEIWIWCRSFFVPFGKAILK